VIMIAAASAVALRSAGMGGGIGPTVARIGPPFSSVVKEAVQQ
jgi:hypothetical protein